MQVSRSAPLVALLAALNISANAQESGQRAQTEEGTGPASAVMMNRDGERLGTVALKPAPNGTLIRTGLARIEPGVHAFHVHETGACEAPDFQSAGGHYNPEGKAHGFLDAGGAHAGDLPNVFVGTDGALSTEIFAWHVSLKPDAKNTLFDSDGSALVIHAGPDDYRTDPAGDAGNRIACGVVQKGPAQTQSK